MFMKSVILDVSKPYGMSVTGIDLLYVINVTTFLYTDSWAGTRNGSSWRVWL
jgi:hypothetical protein